MKAFGTVIARINRASLRERGLMFLAAMALLSMLWNQFLMRPLANRRTAIEHSLGDIRERHAAPDSGHGLDSLADRYAAQKLREAALGAAIADADTQLREAQAGMIAPKEMLGVLTDVLGHQQGLTLVQLRNLAVEPLLTPAGSAGSVPKAGMEPYLHPAELILRGDYLNVLAYLKELESRSWGFQWRRFELTTTDGGPEYRIEFTTLSMQPNWLGV